MTSTPKQIMNDAEELYEKKEADYGESWKLTGQIVEAILENQGEDELVIPADADSISAFALYVRRLDKLVRSFNGTFTDDELQVDEAVAETTKDQVPYAAMQTALAQSMQDQKDRPEYADCPECGDEAVDRTSIASDGEKYEYYCTCSHVWWDD